MGDLVQIKSDTFAARMGGTPNSNWTALKISTAEPQQSSQICPMLNNSGFHEWSKGLDTKYSREKGDLFSFQHKLLCHLQLWEWTLKDLGDPIKMVNLLTDRTHFTQAYVKTAIEEQHKLYDSYDCSKDCSSCYALLDSLDISFKKYVEDWLPKDFCFPLIWMQVISRRCKVTHSNILKQ